MNSILPQIPTLKFAAPCSEHAVQSYRSPVLEIDARDKEHGSYDWIHMVPFGEKLSEEYVPDGKEGLRRAIVRAVFDEAAIAAILKNYQGKLLVDYEHSDQSHDPASSTEAAGWIEKLRRVNDGIEAFIDWTEAGGRKVSGKMYRYISPVLTGRWENLEAEGTEEDPVIFRPMNLIEAGLTNRPKLMGQLRPISNKESSGLEPVNPTKNKNMKYKAILAALLGLDEDIDDAKLSAKVDSFKGELATLKNKAGKLDEVNKKVVTLEEARLEGDLKRFEGVITNKESATALLKADRTAAIETFEGMLKAKDDTPPHATIHNKSVAKTPVETGGSDSGQEARIANRASEIATKEGVSLSVAYSRAKAEIR